MSFIGKLFGSDAAIAKGMNAIINSGDALIFTNQEQAEQKVQLLKAYEPFRLLQRCIVLLFTVPYVLLHTLVIGGCLHGMDWAPIGEQINEAFGYPVLAAVSLYLTGGVLPSRK
ncbi:MULTISPECIES: hypothetical protein [unclassified Vibrio]|uniref:Uncharacterized protein n=1 Tax=Vibrio sp. HB236076 TaxID=3232307 RepID=A0AB39HC51_9VIBR|nr:hypothetical protein [Vibrio sp. HB161653]MDP5254332.1 hypothetical protein [Vibrio sp. HB161653]